MFLLLLFNIALRYNLLLLFSIDFVLYSKSIASNNPTWRLDDYIGDPRQQYTASYPDLDAQRKLYFETGVPNFNPFTSSLLDYNGFIRLVQFFDNSLFKMIKDFTPARASLATGIVIKPTLLERCKYPLPQATTNSEIAFVGSPTSRTLNIAY